MKYHSRTSALRKFIPASALVAIVLSAGMANATVVNISSISASGGTPDATDNDFTRIKNALSGLTTGQTLILEGTFDWNEANARDSYFELDSGAFVNVNSSATISGVQYRYLGLRPPTGVSDITINGQGTVTIIAPNDGDTAPPELTSVGGVTGITGFMGFQSTNTTNLTVTGIEFSEFNTPFHINSGSHNGLTISDNTFHVTTAYGGGSAIVFRGGGGNDLNTTITGNTFLWPTNGIAVQTSGVVTNAGSATRVRGLVVSDNTFGVETRPASLGYTTPATAEDFVAQTRISIYDNANSGFTGHALAGKQTFSGNSFDFKVADPEAPGEMIVPAGFNIGVIITSLSNPASFTDPNPGNDYSSVANALVVHNNVFEDVTTALYFFTWPEADPDLGQYLMAYGNTFTNTTVTNSLAQSWSSPIPKTMYFDLDTVIDGFTGLEAFQYLATDRRTMFQTQENTEFNSETDDPWEERLDYGVTGLFIAPAADPGDIVNNPDWTDSVQFPRFFDPLGNGDLAMGYNAFGDAIDPGDPNRFLGLGSNVLLEISELEELAPGTRIGAGQTVTIVGVEDTKSSHVDRVRIAPTVGSFSAPLFTLDASDSVLNLENVIVSGDAPGGATADIISPFGTPNGGTVNLENATIEDFIGDALSAKHASAVINASDVLIHRVGRAVALDNGGEVNVTESIITNVGNVVQFRGGASSGSLTSSRIGTITGTGTTFQMINGPGNFAIGGAPDAGNIFATPVTWTLNGTGPTPSGVENTGLNFSYNTHINVVGPDSNNDGYIDGTLAVPYVGPAIYEPAVTAITDGKRFYGSSQGNDIVETNIVAILDRSGNGLPDTIARQLGANPFAFDTSGNGIPDGVHVALGLPIGLTDVPAEWTPGSLAADTNNSGLADWYELALTEIVGFVLPLGDLDGNGEVSLTDAVRALQIVNGSISASAVASPHSLNVSGSNPFSLANPLQILRFQAGVRTTFPAVPGIN
ncbi:MAG: hypothetical protein JJU11_16175 [Candidatus Sumerlaeia bacterium]|nr:hypothetical protein [Candidatus Sumerlaeia bacterium]